MDSQLTAETDEPIVVAAIDQAFFTRPTCAIVDDRLYADAISNCETLRHVFSHLFNGARELMAKGHWHRLFRDGMWCCRGKRRAAEELV